MNPFDFMSPDQVADVKSRRRKTDVTLALQRAIEQGDGRIELAAGDYQLTPNAKGHALLVSNRRFELVGEGATIFLPSQGNHQALRFERCVSSTIRGVRFVGSGTRGRNSGQGLVQVFLGSDILFENCAFDDANCDGLAIAGVLGVTVRNCTSNNAAKAALYVNNSRNVQLIGNSVQGFGGFISGSNPVGVGLQISGNEDLLAEGNLIRNGNGIGILCDDTEKMFPLRNTIARNLVENVDNTQNSAVSSGIRLGSREAGKQFGTVVEGNTVRSCGIYNYYIENHDGCVVRQNVGIASRESNYIFSSLNAALVSNNTAIDSNRSRRSGQASYYIINGSRGVVGTGNRTSHSDGTSFIPVVDEVQDNTGNANALRLLT